MSNHDSDGYVGRSVRSRDGAAFVAGRATYTSDIKLPNQLHAHIVRSPHAHARIRSVNLDGALKVHGVVKAMDGAEAGEHLDPIPHYLDPAVVGGNFTPILCLAKDEARYFGQPVAVVVAEDKRTARYAASKVRVDYEPLEAVITGRQAVADDAPKVVPEWDNNTVLTVPFMGGDVDQAFAQADHITSVNIGIHRQSTQPIETRVYNAVWDHFAGCLVLYATAQNPHPLRYVLAEALRLPENQVRIVAPAVGGAFGLKMHGHPEEALICLLAKLLDRPVKWVEDRAECLLVGGREQDHVLELALRKDGKIFGLRDRFIANTGAPSACPGWGMAFLTGLTMPGPYDIPNVDVLMNAVVTHKAPWNASRGYGKEATAIVLELAIDRAARELKLDPAEIRCLNFVPKTDFPKKTPTGLILDSGDYQQNVAKALELLDYDNERELQSQAREQGRYVGVGIAYELTPEGGAIPGTMVAGYDSSTVKMDPSGFVTVLTGVTTPGTGNQTGIAQIVADELGVPFDTIRLVQGDTQACPYGFGNYSGRSTIVGGGSAALAAADIKAMLLRLAAALMEVEESSLQIREGKITTSADEKASITVAEVAYAAYTRAYDVGACIEPPLEATRTFKPGLISHVPDAEGKINPYPSYSNAAYATVCEVDIETGQVTLKKFAVVHDCGKVINPILVEGQACGAVAFGIGGMLGEEIRHDENGRQLTTSFMDYVMPRAWDMPKVAVGHHDSPNPETFMGLKGAGEAGVGGSAAAVVNAVNDALAPLGVEITNLPVSPANIWEAVDQARKAAQERKKDQAA